MKKIYTEIDEFNCNPLVGRRIIWTAPAGAGNGFYGGVARIIGFDWTKERPIKCEVISGDDLNLAFGQTTFEIVDDEGRTVSECLSLAFSDEDRFVRALVLNN